MAVDETGHEQIAMPPNHAFTLARAESRLDLLNCSIDDPQIAAVRHARRRVEIK